MVNGSWIVNVLECCFVCITNVPNYVVVKWYVSFCIRPFICVLVGLQIFFNTKCSLRRYYAVFKVLLWPSVSILQWFEVASIGPN